MMRLQTSSDSISTDDSNDIVLKLTITEGEDKKQIRIVHLEEIIDQECYKPVFEKLMARIRQYLLLDQQIDSKVITISYHVGSEDIVVGSNFELDYAIRQSSDAHLVAFAVELTAPAIPIDTTKEIVLKVTVKKALQNDFPQTRIVQLEEIIDYESRKPSYEKFLDHLGFLLDEEVDSKPVKLSYKIDNEVIVVGSTMELEYAIRQSDGMSMISFTAHITEPGTVPGILQECVPTDLVHHDRIVFPKVRFNSAGAPADYTFSNQDRCITRSDARYLFWPAVYAKEGFDSGCHYWSLKVINKVNANIIIGVAARRVTQGKKKTPGWMRPPRCSLDLACGYVYVCGTNFVPSNASIVTNATTIGVLLNMDNKTVTFYADGTRIELQADATLLTALKYYPVVALLNQGLSVEVEDIVPTH